MYLFRISLKPTDVWGPFYGRRKSLKPIYVVAETGDAAIRYAEEYKRPGLSIKSVSRLAEQLGDHMFSSGGV